MMHPAAQYLGKPFKAGARGPSHFDCWGLIAEILREQGIDIGEVSLALGRDSTREVAALFREAKRYEGWIPVSGGRQDYDIGLMTQSRYPSHVGVWIAGRMLHAIQPCVVAMDVPTLNRNGFRILGFYRHESLGSEAQR